MRGLWKLCFAFGVSILVNTWTVAQGVEDDFEDNEPNEALTVSPSPGADEEYMDEADAPVEIDEEGEDDEPTESVWAEEGESIGETQLLELHKKVDANGDNKVTIDELLAFKKVAAQEKGLAESAEEFTAMDSNDDGKISLDELLEHYVGSDIEGVEIQRTADEVAEEARVRELETKKFKAADHNSDGFLQKDELSVFSYPEHHNGIMSLIAADSFKSRDKNGDGELDHEEFWESEADPEDLEQREKHHLEKEKQDFENLDLDKNGKLNLEEFQHWESGSFSSKEAFQSFIEIVDEDEDGHITPSELKRNHKHLANHMAMADFEEWANHYEL